MSDAPRHDICDHCKKPILEGEARYGIGRTPQHWDCHEKFMREGAALARKVGRHDLADMLDDHRNLYPWRKK